MTNDFQEQLVESSEEAERVLQKESKRGETDSGGNNSHLVFKLQNTVKLLLEGRNDLKTKLDVKSLKVL